MKLKRLQLGVTVIPMMLIIAAFAAFIASPYPLAFAEAARMTDLPAVESITTATDALSAVDADTALREVAKIGGLSGPQLYIAVGGLLTAISPVIQFYAKQALALTRFANTIMPLVIGLFGGIIAALSAGASPISAEGIMIIVAGLTGGATGSSIRDVKKRATAG